MGEMPWLSLARSNFGQALLDGTFHRTLVHRCNPELSDDLLDR